MKGNRLTISPAVRVGIIGYGRFGRLAAKIFESRVDGAEVLVFARKQSPALINGTRFATFEETCDADVIIPCVPISAFEPVMKLVAGKVRPGALVVDICSVMVYPVEVMLKYLPGNVEVLATHPNFGPDSARRGLTGLKIVVYPARISASNFGRIRQACRELGLDVVEMSPQEHDQLMAYSLAYTHLIGRIGEKMAIRNTGMDTKGFAQLLKVQGYVVNDTPQLFKDIQNFNPYAREMRRQFQQALARIETELEG